MSMNDRFNGQMLRPRTPGVAPKAVNENAFSSPVNYRAIDLTSAHTDMIVTFPPCRYIQVTTDNGSYDGCSIKLVDQSGQLIDLRRVNTLPVAGVSRLYFTNDVRQGRSSALIIFSQEEPFGLTLGAETITRAELAVRLGAGISFDRRGEVLDYDNFEGGLQNWALTFASAGAGTGGYVILTSETFDKTPVSMKHCTANLANDITTARKWFAYPALTKIGFEIALKLSGFGTSGLYTLQFSLFDGAKEYKGMLRYDDTNKKYQYYNTGGTYTDFATVKTLDSSVVVANVPFHHLKLVVDSMTKKYVRAIINNESYDLSNIALNEAVSLLNPRFSVLVQQQTTGANNLKCWWATAITTINEP